MDFDYRDPDFYGIFDDVIATFSFDYWAYIKTNPRINPEGTMVYEQVKYKIRGSLQAFRKTRVFGNPDSPIVSSRDGRFYATYDVKLKEGDVIRKEDKFYKVIPTEDYDYAGVRQYDIIRVGYDEIVNYDFEKYIEKNFDEYKKAVEEE